MIHYLLARGIPAVVGKSPNECYILTPMLAECNCYIKIEYVDCKSEMLVIWINLFLVCGSQTTKVPLLPRETVHKILKDYLAKEPPKTLAEELLFFLRLADKATPLEAQDFFLSYAAKGTVEPATCWKETSLNPHVELLNVLRQSISKVWGCWPVKDALERAKRMVQFLESRNIPARWGGPGESLYIMTREMAQRSQYIFVALGESKPGEIYGAVTLEMIRKEDAVRCFIASDKLTDDILFQRLDEEFPFLLTELLEKYINPAGGYESMTVTQLEVEKGIRTEEVKSSFHTSLKRLYAVKALFGYNLPMTFLESCHKLAEDLFCCDILAFPDPTRPVLYVLSGKALKSKAFIEISLLPIPSGGTHVQVSLNYTYRKWGYRCVIREYEMIGSEDGALLDFTEFSRLGFVVNSWIEKLERKQLSGLEFMLSLFTENKLERYDPADTSDYARFQIGWIRAKGAMKAHSNELKEIVAKSREYEPTSEEDH